MALVPREFQVGQQPAGTIPGQFAQRPESAPTDFGAASGRALSALGGALDQAGQVGAANVVREQELKNETEAVEKGTSLAQEINTETAKFLELQGRDAEAAYPAFQERVRELRRGILEGASNQRVRTILQQRTAGAEAAALSQGAQWNARQVRTANVQANESAAQQSIADGIRDRGDPAARGAALAQGLDRINAIGRTAGWDEATLNARRSEYVGRFYSGVISSVAETDPLAAQRIFDANRNGMDAASQVRIENMLSAPVRRERAAGIVQQVTGGFGGQRGEAPLSVAQGIAARRALDPNSPTYAEDIQRINNRIVQDTMPGQAPQGVSREEGAPAPTTDPGTMLREAVRRAGNDTELRAAVISQFAQWRTVMEAGQAQERASMSARVEEIGQALSLGATVSIPEADIRRVFAPEQADRILDRLYTQQIGGQVYQSVQLATPAELQSLREDLQNGTGPISELLRERRGTRRDAEGGVLEEDRPGDLVARGAMRNVLDERIAQRNRDLTADPAQFVLADPGVRAAAERAAREPQNAEAMTNYVTATLAAQARLGVAPQNQRVLSKTQAQSIAAGLMQADPAGGTRENPDTPTLRLRGLAEAYGQSWPQVFQDLVRDGGLPPEFQVLANIPSAAGQAEFARMMAAARQAGGMERLRDAAPPAARQQIERELHTYTRSFMATATASGQSGGAVLAGMIHRSVENLAIYYAIGGASPSEAMQRATDRIINDKYEISGTMRVPKALPNGKPLGLEPVMAAQRQVMSSLTPEQLADVSGNPELPESERRQIVWRAAQRGTWVPNERDNGLVLMMDVENGARIPVRLQSGERVELFYDRLPTPTLPRETIIGADGLILDRAGNVAGADPAQRERDRALDRAGLRGERERREQERRQQPPASVPPNAPPVQQQPPGERRGAGAPQRWEPPR
jgi:hypothetical protein